MRARLGPAALAALLLWGTAGCNRDKTPAPAAQRAATPEEAKAPAPVKLCEHGVPAELCTKCDPDLIDVFKAQDDWCEEHGLPLSHCKVHDPTLTFTAAAAWPADWCKEHAVPESQCTKCNPKLVARFIEAGDYCREHGFPLSVCPVHHPDLVKAAGAEAPVFPPPTLRVRLASAQTAQETGIETERVVKKRFGRTLEVVGQLDFNQNRLAQLSARVESLVLEVKVDVGDTVTAGLPLATLASASVGETQGQLSAAQARVGAARANVQRQEALVQNGITARKALEAAQAELAAAEGQLAGARAALGASGASSTGSGGRYTLTAPFAGTVVMRDAVAGRSAAPGQVLLQVADLSTVWAQLDVPEADAGDVQAGQKVELLLEGTRGERREATITRVGASVDPTTRTVRARVELPNPGARLKAGTFVRGRIQVEGEHDALLVPREAVQRAEGRSLVFVRREAGLYSPVAVELGAASGAHVEVVRGLEPGQDVVTTGAFLLKTEILKESIGAGCCEEGE